MAKQKYIALEDLETYKLSRKLSKVAWKIYEKLNWQTRKTMGDQYLEATDSVGANIAEGYGRYHFLDRVRFYYHARGSLLESRHWFDLVYERNLIGEKELINKYLDFYQKLRLKLNSHIKSTMDAKDEIT